MFTHLISDVNGKSLQPGNLAGELIDSFVVLLFENTGVGIGDASPASRATFNIVVAVATTTTVSSSIHSVVIATVAIRGSVSHRLRHSKYKNNKMRFSVVSVSFCLLVVPGLRGVAGGSWFLRRSEKPVLELPIIWDALSQRFL